MPSSLPLGRRKGREPRRAGRRRRARARGVLRHHGRLSPVPRGQPLARRPIAEILAGDRLRRPDRHRGERGVDPRAVAGGTDPGGHRARRSSPPTARSRPRSAPGLRCRCGRRRPPRTSRARRSPASRTRTCTSSGARGRGRRGAAVLGVAVDRSGGRLPPHAGLRPRVGAARRRRAGDVPVRGVRRAVHRQPGHVQPVRVLPERQLGARRGGRVGSGEPRSAHRRQGVAGRRRPPGERQAGDDRAPSSPVRARPPVPVPEDRRTRAGAAGRARCASCARSRSGSRTTTGSPRTSSGATPTGSFAILQAREITGANLDFGHELETWKTPAALADMYDERWVWSRAYSDEVQTGPSTPSFYTYLQFGMTNLKAAALRMTWTRSSSATRPRPVPGLPVLPLVRRPRVLQPRVRARAHPPLHPAVRPRRGGAVAVPRGRA